MWQMPGVDGEVDEAAEVAFDEAFDEVGAGAAAGAEAEEVSDRFYLFSLKNNPKKLIDIKSLFSSCSQGMGGYAIHLVIHLVFFF